MRALTPLDPPPYNLRRMRYSRAFIPTLKEAPADAQVASHVYLVRGGFIRRVAAGIYTFLPLGWRVLRKIQDILRDELERVGAQEVLMPAAVPGELWQESGRWEAYGPELLRFKDRKGADFVIGPTHEEVIVELVRRDTASYRDLPLNLYQIQSKFRDELRPRAGLLRGREFLMKDAYSFDRDEAGALRQYEAMYQAYRRIFRRAGLDVRAVEADTGAIGGSRSHEFQVLAESGEDAIVACDHCSYAANVEQAEVAPGEAPAAAAAELARVETPTQRTIDEVSAFLAVAPQRIIKTLVYVADGAPVAALVRGDHTVNEIALRKALGASQLYLARDSEIVEACGVEPGFVGPVGLTIPIIADVELRGLTGAVCGGNQRGTHYTGVDLARDASVGRWAPLRLAATGDRCARCGEGVYRAFRGIEVGHVFFLGTKYSEPMRCTFLDEDGQTRPMLMGCYGIGLTRIAAAAVEQHHDEHGIMWPMSIAPFEVVVVSLQPRDEQVRAVADRLYDELRGLSVDVLYDDRDERPGAKFKDADLVGAPLRIAVGARSLKEGQLEVKWRREAGAVLVPVDEAATRVVEMIAGEKARLGAAAEVP